MKCRTCPSEAKLGRTQCTQCLERERQKSAARRSLARAAGVCIRCEANEPRPDRDTCEACAKRSREHVVELRELDLCARHGRPVVGELRQCARCIETDQDRYQRIKAARTTKPMAAKKSKIVNGKRVAREGTMAEFISQFPPSMPAEEVAQRVNASGLFTDHEKVTQRTVHRVRAKYANAATEMMAAAAPRPPASQLVAQAKAAAVDEEDLRFIFKRGSQRVRAALDAVEKMLGGAA